MSLEVGQITGVSINIPVATVGQGAPRLALLCGVHGDETSSFIICHEFLKSISLNGSLNGSISIIMGANPSALSTRTRVSPSDNLDLNRVGEGNPEGMLTERIAHEVINFIASYDFVVDLHEFVMDTPLMAVYTSCSNQEVDRKTLKAISAFSPVTVWVISPSTSREAKYSSTLISALLNRGIPGFIVETSRAAVLSIHDVKNVVSGLHEVARVVGVLEGDSKISIPPAFERNVKYSASSGIWIPTAELMENIGTGDKIGELTSIDLSEQIDVQAQTNGTLIQLRRRDLVDTGSSLFTIGVESVEVSAKLRSAASEQ